MTGADYMVPGDEVEAALNEVGDILRDALILLAIGRQIVIQYRQAGASDLHPDRWLAQAGALVDREFEGD